MQTEAGVYFAGNEQYDKNDATNRTKSLYPFWNDTTWALDSERDQRLFQAEPRSSLNAYI